MGDDECASDAQTLQPSNPTVFASETNQFGIDTTDVYDGKIAPSLCEVLRAI